MKRRERFAGFGPANASKPERLADCGLLTRLFAVPPPSFLVAAIQNGNVFLRRQVPFVPALSRRATLFSALKSPYSGLMVEMGEVSQECRSAWR